MIYDSMLIPFSVLLLSSNKKNIFFCYALSDSISYNAKIPHPRQGYNKTEAKNKMFEDAVLKLVTSVLHWALRKHTSFFF